MVGHGAVGISLSLSVLRKCQSGGQFLSQSESGSPGRREVQMNGGLEDALPLASEACCQKISRPYVAETGAAPSMSN